MVLLIVSAALLNSDYSSLSLLPLVLLIPLGVDAVPTIKKLIKIGVDLDEMYPDSDSDSDSF